MLFHQIFNVLYYLLEIIYNMLLTNNRFYILVYYNMDDVFYIYKIFKNTGYNFPI